MSILDQAVFVAGHNGMVGSAIVRRLKALGYTNIITCSRQELNLLDLKQVSEFFASHAIKQVYLAAAKVGGIHANNIHPAEFIYENLMIEANVIHAAHKADINQLLFLGSSYIYPQLAEQPIRENALLTGVLEPINESHAIAKIAGIKLCESYNRQYDRDYRSVISTNLYGPADNFHAESSRVIPALLNRFHEAVLENSTKVTIGGTGSSRGEFLYVDDMASACVHIMELEKPFYLSRVTPMLSHINVGAGQDYTIKELAELLAKVTGFTGELAFDNSKTDSAPSRLLDVSRIDALGWQANIDLEKGLQNTYQWYLESLESLRSA